MDQARIHRLRDLASDFIEDRSRTREQVGEIEQLVDEGFPDDDDMQDFVSDLSRFTPGGGPHLIDEGGAVRVCRGILRRLAELGE